MYLFCWSERGAVFSPKPLNLFHSKKRFEGNASSTTTTTVHVAQCLEAICWWDHEGMMECCERAIRRANDLMSLSRFEPTRWLTSVRLLWRWTRMFSAGRSYRSSGTTARRSPWRSSSRWRHYRRPRWPSSGASAASSTWVTLLWRLPVQRVWKSRLSNSRARQKPCPIIWG